MDRICRTCLKVAEPHTGLYTFVKFGGKESVLLSEILINCASIQVAETDGLPQIICASCLEHAKNYYYFKYTCEESDKFLRSKLLKNECCGHNLEEVKILDDDSDSSIRSPSGDYNLDDYQDLETTEIFKCNFCSFTSTSKDIYTEHLNIHKNQSNQMKSCIKVPINKKKTNKTNKTTCKVCSKEFKVRYRLAEHMDMDHPHLKTFSCNICDKKFFESRQLFHHKRRVHKNGCAYCDYVADSHIKLYRHKEEEHAHLKTVSCNICSKKFFRQLNLQAHMIVHNSDKKYTCEFCGASFAHPQNLKIHRRIHTGIKPYACPTCGKTFAQHTTLTQHLVVHSDQRDHICAQCGAGFRRIGQLRNHLKRHSTSRPYPCTVCESAFKTSSERKRHMDKHTGIKNHTCDLCSKAFNRRTQLKIHRMTHTGETPHVCTVCGKGFIQSHCLRTHMNTHLKNRNTTENVEYKT